MQLALRRRLLTTTVLIGASMLGTAAQAQDAPVTTGQATAAADDNVIVITGSLITNPNLERATPVTVATSEEIELRQSNTAEQLLRELPGTVPSIGSAVNNGNGGSSFVNLRGLGSNRNVVLLNGVRVVPADLVGRFDLNNVPLALVERVELLTGGASTTYGADAVAGVVNFITKNDFSGLDVQASNQITERGDGHTFRIDVTMGANFDDGRGNVVLSIGYQEADPVFQSDRAISRFNISAFTGGISGSGTTTPARFSVTGLPVQSVDPTTGAFINGSTFAPFNFNPFNVFQTPFERFNIYGAANYEINDAVEIYTRGIYSKNTVSTIIAPSGAFGIAANIPISNPLLPTAAALTLCQRNIDLDPRAPITDDEGNVLDARVLRPTLAQCQAARTSLNPNDPLEFTPNDPNNPAGYDPATGSFSGSFISPATVFSLRAVDVGPRISSYTTQIFDYRAGLRGNITDSITWDVFGAYGESERLETIQNYTLNSRFRQGLNVVGLTPETAACVDESNGCVPINVFGPAGSITGNQIEFLTANSTVLTKTTLAQARGTISGDFGVAIPFAEDAISFAVGGEYRKYTALQQSDLLAQSGDLGGAGGADPNIRGGFDVYEAFGEIAVPLVQDRPFFRELSINAGIRYSAYSVDAPQADNPSYNTTTWKVEGNWSPVEDFRFRGSFNRAVRAPNINELFSPLNTGLTSLQDDPCASLNDEGDPIRPAPTGTLRAICVAQGAPISSLGNIQQPTAGQAQATSGGNLNLDPETADSWTAGIVVQPTFLPGFTASVDYFNIKIEDAISLPTPGDAIAACFGTDPTNPPAGAEATQACQVIRRDPLTGNLSGDPAAVKGLLLPLSNLGAYETDGIDVSMNYNTDLEFARLSLSFNGTYTFSNKFQATPSAVNRECVGFVSVNCGSLQPEFFWNQRTTLSFDNIDLSLLWRHISAFQQEPLEITDADNPAYIGPVPSNTSPLPGAPAPGFFGNRNFQRIQAVDYFDLSARIGVSDNLTLTVTVANLLDRMAPLTGSDIGSTSFNSGNTFPSTYDALGRSYRVAARLRF